MKALVHLPENSKLGLKAKSLVNGLVGFLIFGLIIGWVYLSDFFAKPWVWFCLTVISWGSALALHEMHPESDVVRFLGTGGFLLGTIWIFVLSKKNP